MKQLPKFQIGDIVTHKWLPKPSKIINRISTADGYRYYLEHADFSGWSAPEESISKIPNENQPK